MGGIGGVQGKDMIGAEREFVIEDIDSCWIHWHGPAERQDPRWISARVHVGLGVR